MTKTPCSGVMNIPKFLSQSLQGSFMQNRKRNDDDDDDDNDHWDDEDKLSRQTNSTHNLKIHQEDINVNLYK